MALPPKRHAHPDMADCRPSAPEEDEEVLVASSTEGDARFHAAVGALEAAAMDPEFRDAVEAFCRKHCWEFTPPSDPEGGSTPSAAGDGEYRLEWTERYQEYTTMIETQLERALSAAVADFDMDWFMRELETRAEEEGIENDVFDLLLSLGDFQEFVSLMLSYREEEEAKKGKPSSQSAFGGLAPTVTSLSDVPED
jgi:hypothetical protein